VYARLLLLLLALGCTPPEPAALGPADRERADWADVFRAEQAQGTFVLFHTATGQTERYNVERAARRYVPASTFKLYNALVAVETGVVRDVDSVFVWDGAERSIGAWNRDHTLRSGMASSVVWLYQRVGRDVGRARYLDAFDHTPYGNGTIGGDEALFWLDRSLRISADEHVAFVDRLRRGDTGFSDATEATVRGIVPVLVEQGEGRPVRLLGKTGLSSAEGGPQIGWLVGWAERTPAEGGDVVFALNVEAAGPAFDPVPARLRIVRTLLTREGVLPSGYAKATLK
jgi:beta-lactamase class D